MVYVAGGGFERGPAIVDARDPARPRLAGRMAYDARTVAVDGDRAVVGIRGCTVGDCQGEHDALAVLDTRDPLAPRELGLVRLTDEDILVAAQGGRVLVSDATCGLRAVDMSDPRRPRPGECGLDGSTYALAVAGDSAFAQTGDALWLVDLTSDPPSPVSVIDSYNAGDLVLFGDLLLVYGYYGLDVYDVRDPTRPLVTWQTEENPGLGRWGGQVRAEGMAMGDGMLFAPATSGWVLVLDDEDPSRVASVVVGVVRPGLGPGVAPAGGRLYVLDDPGGDLAAARLRAMDVSDTAHLRYLGSRTSSAPYLDIALEGTTAWLMDLRGAVALDLAQPGAIRRLAAVGWGSSGLSMVESGGYVYVAALRSVGGAAGRGSPVAQADGNGLEPPPSGLGVRIRATRDSLTALAMPARSAS